jgi:transcription elongation factor Elf1
MDINKERLYGGMTTDYFAFFCPKCEKEITGIEFLKMDGVIPVFSVKCQNCGFKTNFKMNVWGLDLKPNLP